MNEAKPKRTIGSAISAALTRLASRQSESPAAASTAKLGALDTNLRGHVGQVRSVAFSPDGTMLLSTGYDCQVKMWDLTTRSCVASLSHGAIVRSAVFTPNGEKIVSGCDDGSIRIWSARSRALESEVTTFIDVEGPPWIYQVCVSPDGRYALSCGYQSTLGVVDLGDGTSEVLYGDSFPGFGEEPLYCACFLKDNDTIVFGGFSGEIAKYTLSTGAYEPQLTARGRVHSIVVSRDTDKWIAGGMLGNDGLEDGGWLAFEHPMGAIAYDVAHWVDRLAIAPGDRRLYAAIGTSRSTKSGCIVFDTKELRETGEVGSFGDRVHGVAVSPDGRLVATACKDGTVGLWHAP